MSCSCDDREKKDGDLNCACDRYVHPRPLNIGHGMNYLDRQAATFNEFRKAMLAAIRTKSPLSGWRGRGERDLGIMLLEMWAYVCDSLSLYDRAIAQESYVRTALRRPSIRKLVALIGYLPCPGVSSLVYLSCLADGRQKVNLPAGTSFRSGGFDGNPPQVFELASPKVIHPLTNSWDVKPVTFDMLRKANPRQLNARMSAEIKPNDVLLLTDASRTVNTQPVRIKALDPSDVTEPGVTTLAFSKPASLPVGTLISSLQFQANTQSASLWTRSDEVSLRTSASKSDIALDVVYNDIAAGDVIIIKSKTHQRSFGVEKVTQEMLKHTPGGTILVAGVHYPVPPSYIPVTRLWLSETINKGQSCDEKWSEATRSELTVLFGFTTVAIAVAEKKYSFAPGDKLFFTKKPETTADITTPEKFLLSDKDLAGTRLAGFVDFKEGRLIPRPDAKWNPSLKHPLKVFGNVVKASRGESVKNEVLGSGDASLVNQVFMLKKKPLTYLSEPGAPNDHGIVNTLAVFVGGVRWKEVASLYLKGPTDQVYVVRHDDDENTLVKFGDGVQGARLPSGSDNIVAFYRFGSGKAAPPAHKVNQIAKPVEGLRSVDNILGASGGDDPEKAYKIRQHAARSALLLGRAVSVADFEAAALAKPGVDTATAEWCWDNVKQTPVVKVWFSGDSDIAESLTSRLAAISDPSTPIVVSQAQTITVELEIDVQIDNRYVVHSVKEQIEEVLGNPEHGVLTVRSLGIAKPLFRSRIFESVLETEGTVAVRNIVWNGASFEDPAMVPGPGKYFDFISIKINPAY